MNLNDGLRRIGQYRRREPLEFNSNVQYLSDLDGSSDDEVKSPLTSPMKKDELQSPRLTRKYSSSTSLSGTTALSSPNRSQVQISLANLQSTADRNVDVEKERTRLAELKNSFGNARKAGKAGKAKLRDQYPGAPEYSDVEVDVATMNVHVRSEADETPGWKPEFLKRASSFSSSSCSQTAMTSQLSPSPPGAVPLTPSLIKAIQRLEEAQTEAYRTHSPNPNLSPKSLVSGNINADGLPLQLQSPHYPYPRHQTEYPPPPKAEYVSISMAVPPIDMIRNIRDGLEEKESESWDAFWRDVRSKAGEVQQ